MRKPTLILLFLLLPFLLLSYSKINTTPHPPVEVLEAKPYPVKTPEDLVHALIQVESQGKDSILGDLTLPEGPSVGVLQIRPIMVREVNLILKIQKKEKRYKLKDRYSREKSIEMFYIWKNYYHPDGDFEIISRNWNGGPKGYLKPKTEEYWKKVQKELEK